MGKLAIVTPVVLQTPEMLNIYLSNLRTYVPAVETKVYVVLNRINIPIDHLHTLLKDANSKLTYELVSDKERSVAGAWNYGIKASLAEGIETFQILAADIALHPDAMKILYGLIDSGSFDLISSLDFQNSFGKKGLVSNSCDFSSVMLNKKTIEKYGYFDKEYKPAYFEDNDYTTRIIVSGNNFYSTYDAVHYHYGSATIKTDAEMAHHVKHWFNSNKQRYIDKWGGQVTHDERLMRSSFYKTPYNSGKHISWWPGMDNPNYQVDGGIHE
jgi:hypothetical protein